MTTIEEILAELGIEISLDTPDKRRAVSDAIKAILNARSKTPINNGGPKTDTEIDLEIDKDLKDPENKNDKNDNLDDYEVEINDPDNLLKPDKNEDNPKEDDNKNPEIKNQEDPEEDSEEETEKDSEEDIEEEPENDPEDESGEESREKSENDPEEGSENDPEEESEENSEEDSENDENKAKSDNNKNLSQEDNSDNQEDNSDENPQNNSNIEDMDNYDFEADQEDSNEEEDDWDFEDETEENIEEEESEEEDIEEDDFNEDDFKDDSLIDKPVDKNDPQELKRRHRELSKNRAIKAAKNTLDQIQKNSTNKSKIERLEKLVEDLENLSEEELTKLSDEQFGSRINDILDIIGELNKSVKISSAEEHELKIKEIKKELEDPNTLRELEQEDNLNIGNERRAVKASEKEKAKYNNIGSFRTISDFKLNFQSAIKNQVQEIENQEASWSVINRRYDGTDRVVKGAKNEKIFDLAIPSIDIYVDCSGSWKDNDIKVGEDILSYVSEYEAKKQIKINLYYFAVTLCSTKAEARAQVYTEAWPEILNNIVASKTKNVVLITDSDMAWDASRGPRCIVDGCVWIIWKNGKYSNAIAQKLIGKRGSYQYAFKSEH